MFARTPRLLLRPAWAEDAQALAGAIGHADVLRNLGRAPMPYGVEEARADIDSTRDHRLPKFLAFARTGGAPRLVGGVGVLPRDEDAGLYLSYWIARPYWGLGFATEASRAVMAIARSTGLPPLHALHSLDNPASGRVLHKLGFVSTGRIERRFSRARNADVLCEILVDGGKAHSMTDEIDDMFADHSLQAA